jgi:hypothetical protein
MVQSGPDQPTLHHAVDNQMATTIYKLTKKTITAYCDAIEIGATLEMAAAYAGIHPQTVRLWLARSEAARVRQDAGEPLNADDVKCLAFAEAVDTAQGTAGINWQQVVSEAAMHDPSWAWKMLTVRFPEAYRAQPTSLELSGRDGSPLRHIIEVEIGPSPDGGTVDAQSAPHDDYETASRVLE